MSPLKSFRPDITNQISGTMIMNELEMALVDYFGVDDEGRLEGRPDAFFKQIGAASELKKAGLYIDIRNPKELAEWIRHESLGLANTILGMDRNK